jgi:hypothetical protein
MRILASIVVAVASALATAGAVAAEEVRVGASNIEWLEFGSRSITLPNAMHGSWWGTLGDEPERELRRN